MTPPAQWLVRVRSPLAPVARAAVLQITQAAPLPADAPVAAPWPDAVLLSAPQPAETLRALAMRATAAGVPFVVAAESLPDTLAVAQASRGVQVLAITAPPVAGDMALDESGRLGDAVIAVLLLTVTLPLVLLAALAIRLESAGSPWFSQVRIGKAGAPFRLFKLRSMRQDAPPYARSPGDDDPAVTRVGRALRASGLDELPQLVNVLRDQMRLVGPRPEMPFVADGYSDIQRQRLRIRPGLTGPWQLFGDRSRGMHEQVGFDLFYIAFRTRQLDLALLGETLRYAWKGVCRTVRFAPSR